MTMRAKAPGRRATSTSRRAPSTIDEYLAGVPEPSRQALERLRAAIRSAAPKGTKETISYRIPAFRYKGLLAWFAAFSDHCSFFPRASVIRKFHKELKGFATSKGTIRFTPEKPLPLALIRKLIRSRVREIDGPHRTQ
jgi:uncharacterized protein YdhG (YjbR/CyaY superfamily)